MELVLDSFPINFNCGIDFNWSWPFVYDGKGDALMRFTLTILIVFVSLFSFSQESRYKEIFIKADSAFNSQLLPLLDDDTRHFFYPKNNITMTELELAIEYLKRRSVSVVGNKKLEHLISVNTASEVQTVLLMVKKGEFKDWYKKMKKQGHRDFP